MTDESENRYMFLMIVNDEINQNPEHNEYIKWWVEGQCLQNKNILLGQWSLLSHYLWSCKFANLKPWGKIWQSKINNTELKAMFWHFLVKLRIEHFVYKMVHTISKSHIVSQWFEILGKTKAIPSSRNVNWFFCQDWYAVLLQYWKLFIRCM